MLEQLIKTLLISLVLVFFLINCLKVINETASNTFTYVKHASLINKLRNGSFSELNGSLVVCIPSLINNSAGRVCVAS